MTPTLHPAARFAVSGGTAGERARGCCRYSDFKVNEVTVHGEVVQLTDTQSIKRGQQHARPAAAAAAVPAADDAPDPNAGERVCGTPCHPSWCSCSISAHLASVPWVSGMWKHHATATFAGYPQEGVDAALADFAALAGDANSALLRDYVTAVLGRTPTAATTSDAPADSPAAAGATAAAAVGGTAEGATAGADGATEATLFPREAALTGGQNAAAAASNGTDGGATVAADSRDISGGGGAAAAVSGRGRPPRHLLLQPILEKAKRGAVHGFFKRELRLPPMRTETAQNTDRDGGNTVTP